MKARDKATGKIIELSDIVFDVHGNGYLRTGLEIVDEPDYWEKLKYQYAGMAMQGMLSDKEMFNAITEGVWPPNRPAYIAARCDEYATALVNRFKEESQCEK